MVFGDSYSGAVKKAFKKYLSAGTIVDYALFSDAVFNLLPGNGRVSFGKHALDEYDLVYFRTTAKRKYKIPYEAIIALYPKLLLLQNITFSNHSSKLLQYACFARDGLSFPHTFFMTTINDRLYARELMKVFAFPFVVKGLMGAKGDDVYLVHTRAELSKTLKLVREKGVTVLAQEHIPNTCDYRIVVSENTATLAFKRIRNPKSEWRNNVSLGATYEHLPIASLDKKITDLAIRGKKAVGWRFAGMDVVKHQETGNYYLFEGNTQPNFVLDQDRVIVELANKLLRSL